MNFKYPETEINTVYIMLGFSCNFSCRHCIQEATDHQDFTMHNDITATVVNYIKHLINIRPTYYPKLKIMFWGGEPLIYINKIKNIINILGRTVDYSLVTNGSLLTEELVEFINTNNIHVALSYDGPTTACVRNDNVLFNKNILELFKRCNNKSICAVLSAYNYKLEDLFADISSKFEEDIRIFVEPLKITWNMPPDLYTINTDEYQCYLHKLAQIAVADLLQGIYSYAVQFFIPYLQLHTMDKYIPLKCMQTYRVLNIDLIGNVYPCHNTCVPIGTINDARDKLINAQQEFVNKARLKDCDTCSAYRICRGGCPNETIGTLNRVSCTYTRILSTEIAWIIQEIENEFLEVDLEV